MNYSQFLDIYDLENNKYNDFGYAINDQILPQELRDDVIEPSVISQILALEDVTILQGKGVKGIGHANQRDTMFCVVQGFYNLTVISPWDRQFIYAGQGVPE